MNFKIIIKPGKKEIDTNLQDCQQMTSNTMQMTAHKKHTQKKTKNVQSHKTYKTFFLNMHLTLIY